MDSRLTPERWRRIETVFHAAAGAAPEDRDQLLRSACEGDASLRIEIEGMLAALQEEKRALPAALPRLSSASFGEYRVDRELGHGGMGTVYLAHRADGQFDQQVALKVVSAHLRSEFFTDRFRTERQILAQLNHPNITRLLDGGVSSEGDPYLVMEYVDGCAINRYCDEHRLSVEARILLFLQVCAAVEYAHRNLIVHRDLKPGNIFVTREGIPKLLDFGTAKLLALAAEDSTTTRFGMMTPRYASPEQLRGEPVTTGTDVYSLGIMLYELVCGGWPFGDPASPLDGLERAVKPVEPSRPAALVTEEAARLRSESRGKLASTLNGDLGSVLNKSIEADLRNRYPSVERLSEDLRRYLEGQPVLARAQTPLYRAVRFAQRNRWRIAAGVGVAVAVGFLAFSALQQYGRNQQRLVQLRELNESYLEDVWREVGKLPGSNKAQMLIVDRARRSLDQLLQDAPRDSEMRRALASAYMKLGDIQGKPFAVSLGDSAGAVASYRKAETLAEKAGAGDWHMLAVLVYSRRIIAQIEARAGHYSSAIAILRTCMEPARRLWKEAPRNLRLNNEPLARIYADMNITLGYAMLRQASVHGSLEEMRAAAEQFRRAVAIARQVSAEYPELASLVGTASQYLGFSLEGVGSFTHDRADYLASAAAHATDVEAVCRLAESAPSPMTLRNCADGYSEWSWALRNAGKGAEAVAAGRQAITRMEAISKSEPDSAEAQQDRAVAYFHLGAAENAAGDFAGALRDLRMAEAVTRPPSKVPANDTLGMIETYLNIQRDLVRTFLGLHDRASAERAAARALAATAGRESVPKWEAEEVRQLLQSLRPAAQAKK